MDLSIIGEGTEEPTTGQMVESFCAPKSNEKGWKPIHLFQLFRGDCFYEYQQRKNSPCVFGLPNAPQLLGQVDRLNRPTANRVGKRMGNHHLHESFVTSSADYHETILDSFQCGAFEEMARYMTPIGNYFWQSTATLNVNNVLATRIIMQISQDILDSFMDDCNIQIVHKLMRRL